jgi:hypothetical protein
LGVEIAAAVVSIIVGALAIWRFIETHPKLVASLAELPARFFRKRTKEQAVLPSLNVLNGKSVRERLAQVRISSAAAFANLTESDLGRLGNPKLIVGNVIMDADFLGFAGLAPDNVLVDWEPQLSPRLPDYIYETRKLLAQSPAARREPNKPKVFLDSWHAPIIDQGGQLRLVACKSDWLMRRALKENVAKLQDDILERSITSFARPLDTDAVVITADAKLILGYRKGEVDYEKQTWSVPGEQMDADQDYDPNVASVSPTNTILRALAESDELHLPKNFIPSPTEIRFVALATEWNMLLANLIAIVKLARVKSTELKDHFVKGEMYYLHIVDFPEDIGSCVASCLPLLRDGATIPVPEPPWHARLNDITRFSILAALFNRFGIMEAIKRMAEPAP